MDATKNGMYQKNTSHTPVPLKSVSIQARVDGFLSYTHIYQEYWNNETSPIEVEYTFPLLEGQVVRSLEIELTSGHVVKAKVEEIEKAREKYDDTIASGNTALMMQNSGSNTQYVLSIGNIPRKSGVKANLIVVSPLKCESSQWSYNLPSNVFATGAKYATSFKLRINAMSAILNVNCEESSLKIVNRGKSADITSGKASLAGKDLSVTFTTQEDGVPSALLQRNISG